MDGFSDLSDDDSNDVENVVGDIGDLESNLLKNSLKNFSPALRTNERVKDGQKRVVFQDDNNDNSVNDLLSDAIDSKQSSKPILGNSIDSKIKDLFKIGSGGSISTKTSSTLVESIANHSTKETKSSGADKWSISNKSSTTDIQSNFGKQAEATDGVKNGNLQSKQFSKSKKTEFMADLFGESSKAASYMDISSKTPDRASRNSRIDDSVSESMPNLLNNDHQVAKTSYNGFTLTNPSTREPRRRNKSAVIDDPLGLLGSSKSRSTEESAQTSAKNSDAKNPANHLPDDNLPVWLGGSKKSSEKVPEPEKIVTLPNRNEDETAAQSSAVSKKFSVKEMSYPDLSLLTGTQLEQQASLVALQQQEYELRTATILSQQADQLNQIVEGQKAKIDEQEKMLNTLVQNQVDRQATLDTQIKMQQARIDHYIQALSRQPSLPIISRPENEEIFREEVQRGHGNEETMGTLHKLEIEKENLENIVGLLRVKHETEIKILEDSHETQMHFMRTSMEKLESRLQNEIESQEKNYEKKMEKLNNEKNQLEEFFKAQIELLNAEHTQIVKEIHTRHSEQIKILQKEHAETIDSISQAKELERQSVDFIQNRKIDLDNMLKQSQAVFDSLQNLSEKLNNQDREVSEKRENSLKRQEQHLQALEEHSEAQREALENERKQLIKAAQKLEFETSQLTSQFKRNTEIYDEAESRMKVREQALLREKELFSEQSKWEREHIQYMKEAWNTEQKRQMQLLVEEREKFLAEKAQLEVLRNLRCSSDDITKAELEAALRTAQEAVKEANQERERWQERVSSIETEKKRIQLKERQLTERAKELEELTQSAISRREEGLKALKDAQRLEKQHNDRMNQLELQLEMLAHRENKIASEKVSLARDRLATKICHAEKPERDLESYSLQTRIHEPYNNSSSQMMQTQFSNVVDPQLILLKLNLDNKLDTSNQLLSDMQIFGH